MEMNWDDGRLFLEVSRQGQMKRAAERLGLTPVTLTRRMAAFEARVGAPVFIRRPNGVILSSEGQRIFEALERAEVEMFSVRAEIDASRAVSGIVRVAVPDGFLHGFILPNLNDFLEKFPHLSLEFVPLPRQLSLSRREADLAIFVGKPLGERIWSMALTDYSLGVYASRDYVKKYGIPHSLNELSAHRLIGFVPDLLALPSLNYAKEAYSEWESRVAIPSAFAQLQAVQHGLGIGMLHHYLCQDQGLYHLLPEIEIRRSYFAATHSNLRLQPRIKIVFDFLKSVTAKNPIAKV